MSPLDDLDPLGVQITWVSTYDGYARLASSPEQLERLLAPARAEYASARGVPSWCGVDLLKGWAFLLYRRDRFDGGRELGDPVGRGRQEWDAVLAALAAHPAAQPGDIPPGVRARPRSFSTSPRMHRDPDFLAAKRARLWEPHIAPINGLTQRIVESGKGDVPYVDPDSGGIAARVLFLLEAPARAAAHGSGMLSADNDDTTAAHVWEAYQHSGLRRDFGVHWNAVPWYVGKREKIRAVTPAEVEEGRRWLIELLELLPELRVLLTMGVPARKAVAPLHGELAERGVTVVSTWHPSPRNYNSRPQSRADVLSTFELVRELADD